MRGLLAKIMRDERGDLLSPFVAAAAIIAALYIVGSVATMYGSRYYRDYESGLEQEEEIYMEKKKNREKQEEEQNKEQKKSQENRS